MRWKNKVNSGRSYWICFSRRNTHGATGEDGDVLEHLLAAVAEAGGLDGGNLQAAAQTVDHEGGQGLALDVLSDDEERTAYGLPSLLLLRGLFVPSLRKNQSY